MATLLIGVAVNAGLYFLNRALMPDTNVEGSRLKEAQITSSTEGLDIARLYGRMRLGGNLFWATKFKETVTKTTQKSGKGSGPKQTTTSYTYDCSFAIGFCEGGSNVQLGRVWADGKLLDMSKHTIRFYKGDDTQSPDPYMQTIEGATKVPAYRGLCYLMFERFQLEDFGNRIPQITAEIIKPLDSVGPDDLEELLEGVCLIPASGEFAYGTTTYLRDDGRGGVVTENIHNSEGIANAVKSLDVLEDSAPNMGTVLLVVSWFSGDLRVGNAKVKPKVEFALRTAYTTTEQPFHSLEVLANGYVRITNNRATSQAVDVKLVDGSTTTLKASYTIAAGATQLHQFADAGNHKITGVVSAGGADDANARLTVEVYYNESIYPADWKVSGVARSLAEEVPRLPDGSLVYGGTPSDISVKEIIADIKARGWRVIFYPFILMDQLTGNGLPDPYGAAEQPPLPWRGRITCHPAPGQPGTVDKTAAAATQVNNFFGSAAVANVPAGTDGLPAWTGSPTEWGYRRMVLHYARLCQMAGGVDGFLIGTELRGITQVRSSASDFPAVTQLITLANDVRSIVGAGTKIGYAADWSEFHSYRPTDGTNDVYFNLDPLWASSNIDFVGIDNYLPLSDWRDGTDHADYDPVNGITSPYVMSYLKDNVEGGEYWDWFYETPTARTNQVRTPINDAAHGEHWVFRQKDIRNWWLNSHRNRPAGVRSASATAWVPQSKPIWFTEFGCPAVDKGTNQPNVFFDPKSSEGTFPYFSTGKRDDLIQRRYLEAMYQYWRDNSPTSGVYGGPMVDTANMFVWTWDARPYPEFPFRSDVWADTENWRLGHWLTGRLGVIPLALLVEEFCRMGGLLPADLDTSGLYGSSAVVRGYVIDKVMSPREMIEPLMTAYNFDGFESEGKLKFSLKTNSVAVPVPIDDLVTTEGDPGGYSLTKAQSSDLPAKLRLSFYDEERDYDTASVDGRKTNANSLNTAKVDLPMVLSLDFARSQADILTQEAWMGRERAELALPPNYLRVDPGDVIQITVKGRPFNLRVSNIDSGGYHRLEAMSFDESVYSELDYSGGSGVTGQIVVYGRSIVEFMDIPMLTGEELSPWAPRLAAFQTPWPGAVNVFQDDDAGGFNLNTQVLTSAALGELVAPLYSGPTGIWDRGNELFLDIYGNEQLLSTTDLAVLNGANSIAVKNQDGGWEVLQFVEATLIDTKRYRLRRLLRGQLGTEGQMRSPVPAGSRVVIFDQTILTTLSMPLSAVGVSNTYRYGPAPLPMADSRYQQVARTFQGVGLKPYAPVHLDADRGGSGVTLSWIRRTRYNGDGWDSADVPLNEESERYEVEVLNGTTVVRTLTSTTPSVLYTNANETADFGGPQSTLKFRVYQMSATIGRGWPGEATVTVT
jgi:hypothetical protein